MRNILPFAMSNKKERFSKIYIYISALAGVAQWIECRPVNQKVAGSIPSQGTCLG